MTEAEWLACEDPDAMLAFLRSRASGRKVRLYACACCRRIWHLLGDERSRAAVDAAERAADGFASPDDVYLAKRQNNEFLEQLAPRTAQHSAAEAASAVCGSGPWASAHDTVAYVRQAIGWVAAGRVYEEAREQAALLRHFVGNPFRPVRIDPAWLAWNGGTVPRLARAVYDERAFDRLPVLADALEDAGCDDPELLGHLRGPGPHVRGCWVIDLLLGKE